MFSRLGEFVARHWLVTILAWLVIAAGLRMAAPRWDDVAKDGNLEFLPRDMPSVVGEALSVAAFPGNRAKSQIVIVFARDDQPLTKDDVRVADRLASRFHNRLAIRLIIEAKTRQAAGAGERADELLDDAFAQLNEAIFLHPANAAALHNRALVLAAWGQQREATADQTRACELQPALRGQTELWPPTEVELPLVDVWTRHNEVFGAKLRSADKQAQLIILQLGKEFMATENIRIFQEIRDDVSEVREQVAATNPGLRIGISGSAAIGGDMLLSAAESIKNTEFYTILLVVVILLVVYRAPLLVIVPLVTIGVSLVVSMSLLSIGAAAAGSPGFEWWHFKVFTTSKIFIVVILFGAGTDFCLFLIARFREHLEAGGRRSEAIPQSLAGVGDALVASALTTIAGLAMMFFADFGKFSSSGPAIGLCLLVTLLACLTLAPAILRAFGAAVFWPFPIRTAQQMQPEHLTRRVWTKLSRVVVAFPGVILVVSIAFLAPFAWRGIFAGDHTTYDLLSALSPSRESYQGSQLLKRHFPIGEGGPIVVLAHKPKAGFDSSDRRQAAQAMAAIFDLTKQLTQIEGISQVRSLAEPTGDPPKRLSIVGAAARRKLLLQQHRLTKAIFLAQAPQYRGDVTRFELVLDDDPFSRDAIATLLRVDDFLRLQAEQQNSFWEGTSFLFAGTTASIRDLCNVTRSDRWRIQILVVLAVFLVLLLILRQPAICFYLILSVLFSYLATIGATEAFFAWQDGAAFQGLDWKVPIFLFVILVAVGEDYNIYLVTRVAQEQSRRGPFAGLREGIIRSGGIITSCGIIMAGTFISMTTGSLRGIAELGFALSLGILLDTFVIRTIVVPAFMALRLPRIGLRTVARSSN